MPKYTVWLTCKASCHQQHFIETDNPEQAMLIALNETHTIPWELSGIDPDSLEILEVEGDD